MYHLLMGNMLALPTQFLLYTDAGPPSPAKHLRDVFYRMGLNDKVFLDDHL